MALGRRLPLVLVFAVTVAGCGGGSGAKTTTDAAGCTSVSPPSPKARSEPKPTKPLDPAKTYEVNIQTNCGSFTIRLAVKTSPATTASFVSLVQKGYFDGTVFHRIVPGFIIQGGDPTAKGGGGPGYTTVDAPPPSTGYTLGVVAMAKTQTQASGTGGSQFFVVTAADAQLPPIYAVLGTISAGKDTVARIGKLGDAATEQPTETVEILNATVAIH